MMKMCFCLGFEKFTFTIISLVLGVHVVGSLAIEDKEEGEAKEPEGWF